MKFKSHQFKFYLQILFYLLALNMVDVAQNYLEREAIISVDRIWDRGQHNAFTSLISYKDKFYVAFREGAGHVSYINGTIRVLVSEDGQNWLSVAHLNLDGVDLRDAQLSITPDNRIMLNMGGSVYYGDDRISMSPLVSFSDTTGYNFSNPSPVQIDPKIKSNDDWLWKATWHKGIAYATVYQVIKHGTILQLVKSNDGIYYEYLQTFDLTGSPNETALTFTEDDKMIALIRRGGGNSHGYIGISEYPYIEWELNELNTLLGGPNLIILPNGKMICGTREYKEDFATRMVLGLVKTDGYYKKLITLPSAGDCSYPGLLIQNNILYVSYYSTHEMNTSIYFSKVRLDKLMDLTEKEIAPSPIISKDENGLIELSANLKNSVIKYTLDGTLPSLSIGEIYNGPFIIKMTRPLNAITINPDYLESRVLSASIGQDLFLETSQIIDEISPGLEYNYFEGEFNSVNDLFNLVPKTSGICSKISILENARDRNFGYKFEGLIKISEEGIYTFFLSSNDGSTLKLNGNLIINNDGAHGKRELTTTLSLRKGIYKISVGYFQMGGESYLKLFWQGDNFNKTEIPADIFYH